MEKRVLQKGFSVSASRFATVAVLLAAYVIFAILYNDYARQSVVFTHFAYIPILLASMWWGMRGVFAPVIIGCAVFGLHLAGMGLDSTVNDMVRVGLFVAVSISVAVMRDRAAASRFALEQSEAGYRSLIEQSFAGVFVCIGGLIVFANSRFAEMLGYASPEELIGLESGGLFMESGGECDSKIVEEQEREYRLKRKNGGFIWVDMARSLTQFGGKNAVLVNAFDITDKKEAQARQKELAELTRKQEEQLVHSTRLAELGEMAAAIAHELNQPLTGIKNFSNNALYMIQENAGSTGDVADNLRMISEQVDRAGRIISQIRKQTWKSDRQFAVIDMNKIIEETMEFLSPQLELAGIETTLLLEASLPRVYGDRNRIEQVMINLITNARHAMEESLEKRLTITTRTMGQGQTPVTVEVRDTGKGFDESVTEKLFAPFFTTKKIGQGTGLGLSISLTIIKDHGGLIEAAGERGKGAKFILRLPSAAKEEKE